MSDFLTKAKIAGQSARLLLAAGDTNGAVNRAYYAMFDAARSALTTIDPELINTKTHASIIRRFGKHLVEQRGFDRSARPNFFSDRGCEARRGLRGRSR